MDAVVKNSKIEVFGVESLLRLWKLKEENFFSLGEKRKCKLFNCSYFKCNQSLLSHFLFISYCCFLRSKKRERDLFFGSLSFMGVFS
jgi:hypothetical protein